MSTDKVVIVTGASRGIGLAICKHLLNQTANCKLLVTARSQQALVDLESQHKDRVVTLSGDIADPALAQRAVDLAVTTWGRLDGLIVNHGTLDPVAAMRDAKIMDWKAAFDTNVFGVVALLQAAMESLRESKGTVLLTSSGAAVGGTATWGAYNASKAVLNSLARTTAAEEPEITILAIRPGVVATEMQNTIRDEHASTMDKVDIERFNTMRKEGKMLRPDQPGNVMARLVLSQPTGLSGEFLNWNDERLKAYQDP